MRTRKPNVIFVTTDHQRYDNIAANGNPHIQTPALDRLAAEGVSLDNCFVQGPICMPSRASIWTGRYPQNHGVTTNGIPLPKTEMTMAHAFAQGGYHTANVGKLHFQPHKGPGRDHRLNNVVYAGYGYEMNLLSEAPGCYPDAYYQWVEREAPQYVDSVRFRQPTADVVRGPFDEWYFNAPEQYHQTAWISHEVRQFLQTYDDPRPFFLSAGFFYPHPPLNPPREYVERYDESTLPLPEQHPDDMARSRYRDVTPEAWQRMKAFFYALCTHIDDHIGLIVETLKASRFADNTIVVFTSDHGDMLGDHGEIGKGPSNYDEVIHVPCIFHAPGLLPTGRRVSGLVESIDLFPTLTDLCGLKSPNGVKGQSIRHLFMGETNTGREDVLVEYKNPVDGFSVKTLRTAEYKYFHYQDGREKLYDMNEDPHEVFDRAADAGYADALQSLRLRLLTRLVQAQDDLPEKTHEW